MLIASFFGWWWTGGVVQLAKRLLAKLDSTRDFFSIGLLLRTLFQPFRMIDAGKVDGPLEVRFRAAIDRLISRIIGGMIRTVVMIMGLVAIAIQAIGSAFCLIFWILMPFLPVVSLILFVLGVAPAWLN